MRTEQFTDEQIIEALKASKGMIYIAAKKIGCDPKTIYRRAEKVPEVKDAVENERGQITDVAELKLFEAITNGESWAITLYLKTRGKDRGYVERVETENTGTLKINVQYAKLNPRNTTDSD